MSKVVGQLLLYCAGLSRFGSNGLQLLRQFAVNSPQKARSQKPKLLKGLSGGITPPNAAWEAMQSGERVPKSKIALWIALDARPPAGLKDVVAMLANEHSLQIGIVSVLGRDNLEVWSPSNHAPTKSAAKADWQTKRLPSKHTTIALDRRFAPHEMQRIKAGLIPEEMEDKWFIYWQNDTLFFHRSWSAFCLFVVHFAKDAEWYRMCGAELNRNPKQYAETSDAKDASLISHLIDVLLLQKEAEFPSDASDTAEAAVAQWGKVGRPMLGQHLASNEDPEPGVGVAS
jgi:8-oxo-dGTP diphosphatase